MTGLEIGLAGALLAAVVLLVVALLRGRGVEERASREVLGQALQVSAEVSALRTQVEHLGSQQGVFHHTLTSLQDVVRALETKLVETGTGIRMELGRDLTGIKAELARDLQEARRVMDEVRTVQELRLQGERVLQQAIGRIEAVMTGREGRGKAGEQIVSAALRLLPPAMMEQGFRVNGKEVEFALVLPGGRRLAIDSKWTEGETLQRLAETPPGPEADKLAQDIERNVARRAREVAQYVSPPATLPWAVAAVPDPAYAACRKAHLEAYRNGVIVIPYSLTLPYLLTLYQLHLQHAGSVDMERLGTALMQVERHLAALDEVLENKVAKSVTMLQNAYGELKRGAGDIRGTLASLRQTPPTAEGVAADRAR